MITSISVPTADGRRSVMPTTQHPIVAYVLRWGVDHPLRDGTPCACPVGALCHAFSLTPNSMEDLLFELEHQGRIRRVPDALGAWDVRVCG